MLPTVGFVLWSSRFDSTSSLHKQPFLFLMAVYFCPLGSRSGQLILTKCQCFLLVLACGGVSHCELTPTCLKLRESERDALHLPYPLRPDYPLLSSTPLSLSLSSGASCLQPPPDSLISQWHAPKAELLRCLLLLRLHLLLRTNRTIQTNVPGFYREMFLVDIPNCAWGFCLFFFQAVVFRSNQH